MKYILKVKGDCDIKSIPNNEELEIKKEKELINIIKDDIKHFIKDYKADIDMSECPLYYLEEEQVITITTDKDIDISHLENYYFYMNDTENFNYSYEYHKGNTPDTFALMVGNSNKGEISVYCDLEVVSVGKLQWDLLQLEV